MMITIKEMNSMKREVKAKTGLNMKDITIRSFGNEFIGYEYFETNYDRVVNNPTQGEIKR